MRYLIIPLLWSAILADVYCMWNYDKVSDDLYYIGEPIVYLTWVLAFWIAIKFPTSEFQRRVILITLLSWIPFCVNTIYRQASGLGHQKSIIDLWSGIMSGIIVGVQIIFWKLKK